MLFYFGKIDWEYYRTKKAKAKKTKQTQKPRYYQTEESRWKM